MAPLERRPTLRLVGRGFTAIRFRYLQIIDCELNVHVNTIVIYNADAKTIASLNRASETSIHTTRELHSR